ncbi:MAG: tRNA (guanosine(37)-N1)-methyltransferase TrmD [Oscillospiraceae bacterium]|nr:tRNA (guanosine(37)-N1)-methyltransferase TrmD [Oscillospiraceae bacterium]
MRIEIATLFPEMCERVLDESIIGRARRAGKLDIRCRNIRDYTLDKHRRVDDTPYGGGKGMLMQVEPIYRCWEAVCEDCGARPHTIYLSPKGSVFSQKKALELKEKHENILLLCGHYEGVDQRVLDEIVDEEISIGDFVLTGGELGALVIADAVGRLCDGVLSESVCFEEESHFNGLLEYPQYTRPPVWHGREVPEVLLSGHHANIVKWRREESLRVTRQRRPDLLEQAEEQGMLDKKDRAFLQKLQEEENNSSLVEK